MEAILCATVLAVSGTAFAAEGGPPVLGTAVRGSGGAVFTVPPQSRTVWADVEWVAGGETFGFGMYEAVRDVFGVKPEGGWPTNYIPADIGRGPYPVEDEDGGPVHPFNGLRWR